MNPVLPRQSSGLTSADEVIAMDAAMIGYLLRPGRVLAVTRHALMLEVDTHPELR